MRLRAHIALLTLLLMVVEFGSARTINVSSASAVNKTWGAGDTLVFSQGTFSNQSLVVQGTGTQSQPIVLQAQIPGRTILTGSSTLTISGTYIEVSGLDFSGTYTGKNHVIQFASASSHCRLTECAIESYNTTNVNKDYKWVSLRGSDNRVDHCLFENKTNIGTLFVVWLETGVIPNHRIDHNRFLTRTPLLDDNGKEQNGQEIIRIGDSSTSMQTAGCVVEYNYFHECDGEIETISNKSCGNVYRYNTFNRCSGMLTLRHGNNCLVEENFFLGNGKSGSGGVRIIGEGHIVRNNYFCELTGNNYRAAICMVRGKENSALNEYFQVKNANVSGNVFANCKEAFCINYNSSSDCTLPPITSRVDSNIVFNFSGKNNYVLNIASSGGSVVFADNMYNTGKWKNYTASLPAWKQQTGMAEPQPDTTRMPSELNTGPLWRGRTTDSATPLITTEGNLQSKGVKVRMDGKVYIRHDNVLYDVMGRMTYFIPF
ncbi:MAG: polysaccharide lyase 6 family protein [Paludibacteraceae bacterium]|nr:polysaccharide lyase 6 family protein [Paludibacteraceae bacterium]